MYIYIYIIYIFNIYIYTYIYIYLYKPIDVNKLIKAEAESFLESFFVIILMKISWAFLKY